MSRARDLLRSGKYDEAVRQYELNYERKPDDMLLLFLAIAYIFANRLDDAGRALDSLIAEHPRHSARHYEALGVVHWLRGDPEAAIATWKDGMRCGYGDGAGGLNIPLLLFFAVSRLSSPDVETVALTKMEKLARSLRSSTGRVRSANTFWVTYPNPRCGSWLQWSLHPMTAMF